MIKSVACRSLATMSSHGFRIEPPLRIRGWKFKERKKKIIMKFQKKYPFRINKPSLKTKTQTYYFLIHYNTIMAKTLFWSHILELQLIWSLHFGSSQFEPWYFQLAINLISTINLLIEKVYVANSVHCCYT